MKYNLQLKNEDGAIVWEEETQIAEVARNILEKMIFQEKERHHCDNCQEEVEINEVGWYATLCKACKRELYEDHVRTE